MNIWKIAGVLLAAVGGIIAAKSDSFEIREEVQKELSKQQSKNDEEDKES